MDFKGIEKEITKLVNRPGQELAGLSIAVTDSKKLLFHNGWGRRYIDRTDRGKDLPMHSSSLCRVASISKTICALTALTLQEQGLFDLHKDLSEYLGFSLSNPNFPNQIITAAHLFTHTSSLRDRTTYNLPKDIPIRTLLSGSDSYVNWSRENSPESGFFDYSNLGYGLMATVLEIVTGKNYHDLTNDLILNPLVQALGAPYNKASFSLQDLTKQELHNLATLYRKWDETNQESSSNKRNWTAQCDSPTAVEMIISDSTLYHGYKTGTNGTLFSPQGGLRASVLTLSGLARLFLGMGKIEGKQIVPQRAIEKMLTIHWRFNPKAKPEPGPEQLSLGYTRASGYGIFKIMNDKDKWGSDRFLPEGGPQCWGHHADAYGLKGALYFDPEKDLAFSYLITGTSEDPESRAGKWSTYNLLEETITSLIIQQFWS